MAIFANLVVRGIALVFTIIITALIGNVIADNVNGPVAAVNFTIFVAALSWVVCLVGMAACFFSSLGSFFIMLPLDILAVIFTFVDAIVLSARLGAVNCGNWALHSLTRSWIAFGSPDIEKRCREIQASTVFMWFLWVCFCIALVITIMQSRSGGGTSPRHARPSMSQVGA